MTNRTLKVLSGTNCELIVQDYIESYVNNNGVSVAEDYDVVGKVKEKVDRIIRFVGETEKDISEIDFIGSAKLYLSRYGLSESEILKLHKKLKS